MKQFFVCIMLLCSSFAFGQTTIHTLPGEQRCCTGSDAEETVYTAMVSHPGTGSVTWNLSLAGSFQSSENNTIYFTLNIGDARVFGFVTTWQEFVKPWTLTATVRLNNDGERRILHVSGEFIFDNDKRFPVVYNSVNEYSADEIPVSVMGKILNNTPKTENDKVVLTQLDIIQQ